MKTSAIYLLSILFIMLSACGEAERTDNRDRQADKKQEKKDKKEKEEKVELVFPRLSPRAEVTQLIGITEVKIDYSRPSVRDREIWGELVPYGETWRTGADGATNIKFKHNVSINGNKLEAGKYSIRSIPREEEAWTFIFNKETDDGYDRENDALRIDVEARPADEYREMLTFYFDDVTDHKGRVVLAWENLKTGFDIEVETHKMVTDRIKKAMEQAGDDDWRVYNQSARYLIDRGEDLDRAEKWINKALDIEENWRNHFTKGLLKEAQGDNEAAIEHIELAIEIGNEEEEEFGAESFLKSTIERLEQDL